MRTGRWGGAQGPNVQGQGAAPATRTRPPGVGPRAQPRARRPPPAGPHWTHVLFTWKPGDGLKVYVNGSLSTWDPSGKASPAYGEPSANLVIGSEQDQAQRYEGGAFDEFVVWERALSPEEVAMYFTAAVGQWGQCGRGAGCGGVGCGVRGAGVRDTGVRGAGRPRWRAEGA